MSSKSHFTNIARSLLLGRSSVGQESPEEGIAVVKTSPEGSDSHDVDPGSSTNEVIRMSCDASDLFDVKPSAELPDTLLEDEHVLVEHHLDADDLDTSDHPTSAQALLEVSSHIQEQEISFFTPNEECEPSTAYSAHCNPSSSTNDDRCTGLCMTFRDISPNVLSQQLDDDEQLPERYGPKAKAVIRRVGQFFDEMKSALGSSCEGTLFDTPVLLTAAACGVPTTVVMEAIKDKEQVLSSAFPAEQGSSKRTERMQRLASLKRYGVEWGDQIRQCICNRIESDAAVTIKDIHADLRAAYADFTLSVNILRRLVRGLGFSYTSQKGKRFIFERTEPSQSKFHQAQALANAIVEGECVERVKETWEVKGTMKKRGWIETGTDELRAAEGAASAQEVGLEGTVVKRERKDDEQEDFLIFTEEDYDAEFSDGFDSNKNTDEEDVYQGEELRADLLLPKEE